MRHDVTHGLAPEYEDISPQINGRITVTADEAILTWKAPLVLPRHIMLIYGSMLLACVLALIVAMFSFVTADPTFVWLAGLLFAYAFGLVLVALLLATSLVSLPRRMHARLRRDALTFDRRDRQFFLAGPDHRGRARHLLFHVARRSEANALGRALATVQVQADPLAFRSGPDGMGDESGLTTVGTLDMADSGITLHGRWSPVGPSLWLVGLALLVGMIALPFAHNEGLFALLMLVGLVLMIAGGWLASGVKRAKAIPWQHVGDVGRQGRVVRFTVDDGDQVTWHVLASSDEAEATRLAAALAQGPGGEPQQWKVLLLPWPGSGWKTASPFAGRGQITVTGGTLTLAGQRQDTWPTRVAQGVYLGAVYLAFLPLYWILLPTDWLEPYLRTMLTILLPAGISLLTGIIAGWVYCRCTVRTHTIAGGVTNLQRVGRQLSFQAADLDGKPNTFTFYTATEEKAAVIEQQLVATCPA